MDKKEEVFSLYSKLNILLSKEKEALQCEDIDKAFKILEEENKIIEKIDTFPKNVYIIEEEDRKFFAEIINVCIKKRKENEELLLKLKDKLKDKIIELEEKKKVLKSYSAKGIVSPKFIDKTR